MEYFNQKQLLEAKKQKNINLAIYLIVTFVYVVISVIDIIWYVNLPYGSNKVVIIKLIEYVATGLFIIFSFIFLGIPYKRVKSYYKVCLNMANGKKEKTVGVLVDMTSDVQLKDGVDFKTLLFMVWNEIKQDFFERKVLIFHEKPFPEIPLGAKVEFVTQGNVLISYEIIELPSEEEEK